MDYEITLGNPGFTLRQRVEKAVATLGGMLAGVAIDRDLNLAEARELKAWLDDHEALASRHPFNELAPAVKEALADGRLDPEERADLLWLCDRLGEEGTYWDEATSVVQRLHGIFHGVFADGILEDAEVRGLSDWVEENRWLRGLYPFDELESRLTAVLRDGRIDDNERSMLESFFGSFIRPSLARRMTAARKGETMHQPLAGCCAVDPELHFTPEMEYCWTGASTRATRADIADLIKGKGAGFSPRLTHRTNYLVIGAAGNAAWAYSCYGRKVEEAMRWRSEGRRLTLVHELDFWDAMG